MPPAAFDVKRVDYVDVRHPTDFAGLPIAVPDRLAPMDGRPVSVKPNENQPFWLTVKPPDACGRGDASVVAAPVQSMRIVHLRDGLEDYEYFAILKRLDPANPMLHVPYDVMKSLTDFDRSIESIEAHRIRLAREIECKSLEMRR